ncbi:BTAD domain-containing putative transcriptional regulator [Kitasatospora purpeofusca]|uniref:BTAD domain-containing putative transcriptional regulator n=1 Tax=Kitasatospora purpeofusca TaxID=67352 RepID=UPI0036D275C4
MAEGTAGGPAAFGARLQAFRGRAGLGQEAAATRAGISTRALRDLEHGRVRRPRTDTLRRLAGALELTGAELADLVAAGRTEPARGAGAPRLLILGPLALQHGRTPVPVTGPMLRRLLGLLALKHPGPATPQEITDTLWPSGPPGSHQSLVHGYVSQVRRLLAPEDLRTAPPTVVRTPTGYRLEAARNEIDLGRFDELLERAHQLHRAPNPEAAYEALTRALRCWRGPVLADADPALRRHPAAVAADERRVGAALLHADTALLLRRSGEAVPVLSELVTAEPLHEGLHARLILALAGCGEQAAALTVFGRLRDRLDEELGVAPGPEVHDAHLRVLRRQVPLAPVGGAAPTGPRSTGPLAAAARPAQLPAATGCYVGRRQQLEELDALVAPDPARRPHVVAVVGAPGIGKTALATHWAHARRKHFEDGQLFVDLHGHSRLPALRPGDVLARFLRALGVRPDRLPADQDEAAALYRTLLADRRMLIVLDNARDAEQVRPLIPGAPGCAVLITSRSRLAGLVVDGARRLGLDVLGPDEARHLLGSTVGACRVAAEEEAARELVRLCGGLPLAIRIAGANLVSRGTRIADHCAELAGGDVLGRLHVEGDRHSTVRAAFDLSYRALPPAARRMFRLLGLMPGPDLTADGAAALAGSAPAASAALLAALADAHLVQERAAGRFGLHDLLRSYARELVGGAEAHAARNRLFGWYLDRTDAAARLLFPTAPAADPAAGAAPSAPAFPDHGRAAQWLERERENLAGAVQEASGTGFTAVARRLARHLHSYLSTGMYTGDCSDVATAARLRRTRPGRREDPDEDITTLGLVCWQLGRLHEAAAHFTQVARHFRELDAGRAEAISYTNLGVVHRALGRPADAIRVLGGTLPAHLRSGNKFSETVALNALSGAHTDLGDHATGRLLAHTALAGARTLRNRALEANAFLALGAAQERAHRPSDAADSYREALRLAESVHDRFPQAAALVGLATVQTCREPRAALRTAERAVALSREARFRMLEGCALDALARTRLRLGESRTALESGRAALAVHRETGHRPGEARSQLALGHAQSALGARGPAFEHWREARRLSRAMGGVRLR